MQNRTKNIFAIFYDMIKMRYCLKSHSLSRPNKIDPVFVSSL